MTYISLTIMQKLYLKDKILEKEEQLNKLSSKKNQSN
jgi:hypothetical protein